MNPQYSKLQIFNNRLNLSKIVLIKSLSDLKINVSVETEDEINDVFDKLYNNNFKNTLQQHNKEEVILMQELLK